MKDKEVFTLFRGADSWVSYWLSIFTVLFYTLFFTVIMPVLKVDFNWYLLIVSIVFLICLPLLTWYWFKLRKDDIKNKKK